MHSCKHVAGQACTVQPWVDLETACLQPIIACDPAAPANTVGCSLMGRVQALDALRATYNVYIKTTGLAILMDEEKVHRLLHACTVGASSLPKLHIQNVNRARPYGRWCLHARHCEIRVCALACGEYEHVVHAAFQLAAVCLVYPKALRCVQDKDMVKLLLEFKARLDTCLAKAFQNNLNFSNAQKEAFEHFINQVRQIGIRMHSRPDRPEAAIWSLLQALVLPATCESTPLHVQRANKPAELIAKFVDAELRGKITSQEELESTLDQALLLFRFISVILCPLFCFWA